MSIAATAVSADAAVTVLSVVTAVTASVQSHRCRTVVSLHR